jgi:hypothetical protein
MKKHGGHDDLRNLDRQSIIFHVHGRMEVVVFLCVVLV